MRVVTFGSTKLRVSALMVFADIYEFLVGFIGSRCKIFARGCEFCTKLAATATFSKFDSRVRTGNLALVTAPMTFSVIEV